MVKIAYIAGPYRGKTINDTRENIRRAEKVAAEYWAEGYAVICPHTNSAFMDGVTSDDFILRAYLEILTHCDLIVMLPGWESSVGSREEYKLAEERGLEVIIWEGEGK